MPGGIRTPDQLWQLISAGKDGVCEVPADRWDWRRYYSEDREAPGKIYVRKGAFMDEDIRQFDAEFFGISPREAKSLDPQQRLLLETSWEALDDAGLNLEGVAGSRTGVYVGGFTLDNMLTQMSSGNADHIGQHSAASSTMTMLSNRVSYFLDLHGPSLSLDTACSSSLVAFHVACQALWNDECEMALVGAVNVMFRPEMMIAMCKGGFLAPDGRSKAFDDRADGYGRGEGAGVLVVKPWWKALADSDRIYALVRATGCNQDGKTNGITVPNGDAQKTLIKAVLERADVPVNKIRYVEAHGTGTPVGDPIEARAIGETLGQPRDNGEPLAMGSIKANIGHLEAASGVAGLIKLCMCFKYRAIPPLANLEQPNRTIPFESLNLRLPRTVEPFPPEDNQVFLAINSFGYGGTNAHAILESPPAAAPLESNERKQLVVLPVSARSETALRALVAQYRDSLMDDSHPWQDLCAALSRRRSHHDYRAAFVGSSRDELIAQIDEWFSAGAAQVRRIKRHDGRAIKPVFVFSGMGPQWWGMGQQLYDREPAFRAFVTHADEAFRAVSGWSILEEMRRTKETSRINQTIYAQPAIFVLQAGLIELLRTWGVRPAAVMGHSVGEKASAYAAGALTLEQTVQVGYYRSQILARAANSGGGMLAVGLSEDEAQTLIASYGDKISIAAINAPKSVTLAGDTDALAEVAARLKVKSIFNRSLVVEVPYHSAYLDPLQQPLIDSLVDLRPSLPSLHIYSTVTGAAVTELAYDGPYWARNIRQSVLFMRALASAVADGHQLFLEVGAHPALTPSIREYAALHKVDLTVVTTLVRETDECKTLFRSLASLYVAGCDLNWGAINGVTAQMLSLPAYPWQRETHWEESESARHARVGGPAAGLAGHRLDMHEPVWERRLSNKYLPYLDHHVVQKLVLLPGAAFVDAALSLQQELGHVGLPVAVEDVQFQKPLVLDRNDEVVLRTAYDAPSSRVVFHGKSRGQQAGWTRHAEARLSAKRLSRPAAIDLDRVRARLGAPWDVASFYARLATLGLEYGPSFRRVSEIRANDREVLARLTAAESAPRYDISHVLHPALLDGAFQSLFAPIASDEGTGFVPATIEQVAVFDEVPDEVWSYGEVVRQDADSVVGTLWLLDPLGRVFATVTAMRCARVSLPATGHAALLERRLFQPTWHQVPLEPGTRRTGAWLVLAEGGFPQGSLAADIADRLRRAGCERVATISADSVEDWRRLLESPQSLAGLAYVTGDATGDPDSAITRAGRLLELFKQLPANESGLRAYLVTERAEAAHAGDAVDGYLQASAIGFFRVAHNEYPGLTCTVIDHDGGVASAEHVAGELLADTEADDVAWRAGVRYLLRIEPCTLLDLEKNNLARRGVARTDGERYALARTESGFAASGDPHRDVLYWKHADARALAEDEIEIAVAYWQVRTEGGGRREPAGHQLIRPHWRECSGRISRIGSAVKGWQTGEPIAAAVECALGSHVIVREQDVRAIRPGPVPLVSASSLAMTAASVNVALRQMARAERGESVLVVSAAGDDVARRFADAATTLGLQFVAASADESDGAGTDGAPLDLRSNEFERLLLAANQGRPVDIVVFCGAVPPALYSRIPLALGGRVVLYGHAAEAVDPARFLDPATMYSLHRVNPTALVSANAPAYRRALVELSARGQEHAIGSSEQVGSADALCRQSLEEGRGGASQAVDMSALREVAPPGTGEAVIDADAAYMITGGFGGFGMAVAGYLIAQGARHIVLIGRSGATTEGPRTQIAAWRAQGVSIREALLDINSRDAVEALCAELSKERAVKGIMHAAGVIQDARIADMTGEQLVAVMRPKVLGAWNLHTASVKHRFPLEHFVLFSSVASIVGNGTQANYVAANTVLDSLAAHRRAAGLAATSINWGALADVGMATSEDLLRHFQLMGITPFSADDAMIGLHAALRFQPAQIGIMDVDWPQWGKFEPTGGKSLRFAHLTGRREGAGKGSMADSLRQLPPDERFSIVELMLAEQVAQTLRIPAEKIDLKRPLTDMGIDSLMTVELQIAINMTFGIELSALELTRGFSVTELTMPLMQRMGLADADSGRREPAAPAASAERSVDELSEAELDALLASADDAPAAN